MIPHELLGTIPQWITAGGLVTLIAAVLKYKIGWRKLSNEDEADIRDHYAQEVAALRAELNQQEKNFRDAETHLRDLLRASDVRHEECERARADSRREVEGLHREIEGMRRQIIRYSADGVLMLNEQPSEAVRSAAERVKKIAEDKDK